MTNEKLIEIRELHSHIDSIVEKAQLDKNRVYETEPYFKEIVELIAVKREAYLKELKNKFQSL